MKKKLLLLNVLFLYFYGFSQTWEKLNVSISPSNSLLGISAPSPTICYAVGAAGTILKTTDGGTSWVSLSSGVSADFYAVTFTDVNTGYAVGNSGAAVKTVNGGTSWVPINIPAGDYREVWFESASIGYMAGGTNGGTTGLLYKTTDAGANWTKIGVSSSPSGLYSVSFTSPTVGYTTDYKGNVYKTTDAGVNWSSQNITTQPLSGSMFFLNPSKGFAAGEKGTFKLTTNGGITWNNASIPATSANIYGIDFYDANHGCIVGGNPGTNQYCMFTTSDGGTTWNTETLTPAAPLLYHVDYYDAYTGYATGRTAIYKWSAPLPTLPDARFTSSEPGCLGQLENFYSVDSSNSHSWDFGAGATPSTSTQKNPEGIVYSSAGAKLVRHIVSNGIVSDTVTTIITINPSPVAAFTSNATACMKEAMNFTNTSSSGPGVTYAWDFGNGAQPAQSAAPQPTGIVFTSSGSKDITLTVTNQFGCITSTTKPVSINPLPVAFAGLNKSICANTSIQLGTTSVIGNGYSWTAGATLSNPSISDPVATPLTSTVYKLTVTTLITGCKNYDSVEITVNPVPVSTFTSNTPVCQGDLVNFQNTGTTGAGLTFAWDFGDGAVPRVSSAESPNAIEYVSGGSKPVTFSITNQYGCVSSSVQNLVINALPNAFAGKDTTICKNAQVQIGQPATAGETYSWFPSATLSSSIISDPVASPISPVTEYILTVKNTVTGCINHDTAFITMLDPLIAYAGVDGEICRYASFQLGTGNVNGQNYSWKPAKGLSDPFIANPVATPDSTTTYTVSITGSGCGTITDNVMVQVHQLPLVDAGLNDTIVKGATIPLNATGGIQYKWLPETGLSNPGIYNPMAHPTETTLYKVTATDIFGCENSDSALLTVILPKYWVPTAFTPDGNGISDVFYVRGEGIQDFELMVFNRWGEQLFISRNIEMGWDGKRQNGGENLPEGAYIYHIKGTLSTGEVINTSGQINLIR